MVVVDLAVAADRVPDREGHAEEPLAADEPVAGEPLHPVVVAGNHVRREPAQLARRCEEPLAQLGLATPVADVPLAARDDLERAVAALVELDRVGDRPRVADQRARLAQELDDRLPGLGHRAPGQRLPCGAVRHAGRRLRLDAAVAPDDRAHGQLQLAPPRDVGDVAEGADHGDAGALLGLGQVVRQHGHLDAEQRRAHGGAEARPEARVVGMRDQRDARGDQLRSRGVDLDVVESHTVVRALQLAVLELGLGDGGLEVDVPERGRLRPVGLASCQVAEERTLGHAAGVVADRRVVLSPVDREPEVAPDLLERLLVLLHQPLAQLDEVGPRGRDRLLGRLAGRLERRVVCEGRVAADAEVVLDAPLGGEAVVVPAHRVEDLVPAHAAVAGDRVGLHVPEHRPHVQRPAHRRRRRVDRVDLGPALGAVEAVGGVALPPLGPLVLEPVEARFLGDGRAHRPVTVPACSACTTLRRERSSS